MSRRLRFKSVLVSAALLVPALFGTGAQAGDEWSTYYSYRYDTDQDRVSNRYDLCPSTPLGAIVDSRGCPTDTDKDGVYDGLDQCAGTPFGTAVNSAGCPVVLDSDGDGVPNATDACPTQGDAGYGVNSLGCPNPPPPPPVDSDGDGMADSQDPCPTDPTNSCGGSNGGSLPPDPTTCPPGQSREPNGLSIMGQCRTPADCFYCHKDAQRFPVLNRSIMQKHPQHASFLTNCFDCHAAQVEDVGVTAKDGCLAACHLNLTTLPTNSQGLPITVVGSPESGTNRHHYSDTYKNGSCHTCHVFPETQLTSSEICTTCHNGQVAQKNIVASFQQPYAHPLDALGRSANGVQVSCLDCHNPNKVTSTNRLRGVQGVEPVWLGNWLGVSGFNIVASVEKQYQLCFKCHSSNTVGNKFGPNYATNPPFDSHQNPEFKYNSRTIRADEDSSTSVTLSGWDGRLTDQAKEFNPNNNSYHPVVAVGKNDFKRGTTDYSSSLINGWKPTSIMTCSDCHRDKDRPDVAGPHGSSVWPIASGPFTGNTGMSSTSFTNDMCFKCHDRNVYGYGSDSSKDDGHRTGFTDGDKNLHYYHVEGKEAQCTTCHSAVPHGWKRKALLIWGAGKTPDPAPYNNHAKYPYRKDNTYSYGINSATPIDSIPSGGWRKEVCHDAGGGTGECK